MIDAASRLLCEVLDNTNAPLCLMPLAAIHQQKLRHRQVGCLPYDSSRFLLRIQPGAKGLELPFLAPLPAGEAASSFAVTLAGAELWPSEAIRHVVDLEREGCWLQIFGLKLSPAWLSAQESPGLELVEKADLSFFQSRKLLGPVLRDFLQKYPPGRSK